jgi:hypothetical protein
VLIPEEQWMFKHLQPATTSNTLSYVLQVEAHGVAYT